jgi:Ala-tRNA(Pro) deacylase
MTYLGVIPGAVTPFGIIHDRDRKVTVVLERSVAAAEIVHAHPLSNDKTTAIRGPDLIRFLDAHDHSPVIVDLTG